jgi:DNA (cytosine-5)-methyltransferase 1
MNYATVCSGIEAPSVAWESLGWKAQWFSEVEPFPCRVLKHHYPSVPNLGDMLKLEENKIFNESTIDLFTGGTPCQSFSIAGLRGGLDDVRGNLSLEFCRILITKRPRWFLWENVPGIFSSFTDDKDSKRYTGRRIAASGTYEPEFDITQTADFAALLSAFSECGYSCAWRILDAQYFGVPQRRRRVFVIGYLGNDWRPPFAVLFERESLQRDNTPQRTQGQNTSGTINASAARSRGAGIDPGMITAEPLTGRPYSDRGSDSNIIMAHGQANAEICEGIAPTLNCNHEAPILANAVTPIIYPLVQITSKTNGNNPKAGDPSPSLTSDCDRHAVLYSIMPQNSGKDYKAREVSVTQPLTTNGHFQGNQGGDIVQMKNIVRRLTPLECERLQGFPDHYTAIPRAADGPRYKAIGNSMAVPVMRWIGQRIQAVDDILKSVNPIN